MSFMPAVSAQADGNIQTNPDTGKVVHFTPPELKIIENTHTSCIVDIGDVRINLTSNQEHTAATMIIRNTKTNEQQRVDYKTTIKSGSYVTQVTVDGKPGSTFTTNYDPFEPGTATTALETNTETSAAVSPMAQSYYYWDGVYFTHGSGIKYPHPDYPSYGAYAYEDFYISGTQLYHRHIDSTYSTAIGSLPAAVVGGAVAGLLTADPVVAGVVGGVLALALGATSCQILLDEQGCIWEWDAKTWATVYVPVAPYSYSLPRYERISQYTLWNVLGISNP